MSYVSFSSAILVLFLLCQFSPVVHAEQSATEQSEPVEDEPNSYVVWGHASSDADEASEKVIDEALQNSAATSLSDVMSDLASVTVHSGSRGDQNINLRGFNQRQLLVLLNGAPLSRAYDGQIDLGLWPSEAVESIQFISGSEALLLAPGALGGAINIITRSPSNRPRSELKIQSRGAQENVISAYHDQRIGSWSYAIYAGLQQRQNWPLSGHFSAQLRPEGMQQQIQAQGANASLRLNSDRETKHLGGDFSWKGKHDLVTAQIFVLDGSRGAPSSLISNRPRYWRFSQWRELGAQGQWRHNLAEFELEQQLYSRLQSDQIDAFDDVSYRSQISARAFRSLYRDSIVGASWRLHSPALIFHSALLRSHLALNLQQDQHQSQDLAIFPENQNSQTDLLYQQKASISALSELYMGGDWRASLGLQMNALQQNNAQVQDAEITLQNLSADPLLALQFSPWDNLQFNVSVAHRSRFPNLKEQSTDHFDGLIANPSLGAEQAWHIGANMRWRVNQRLFAQASIYDAEVQDLIEERLLADEKRQLQNMGRARFLGQEILFNYRQQNWLTNSLALSHLFARKLETEQKSDQIAGQAEWSARWTSTLHSRIPCPKILGRTFSLKPSCTWPIFLRSQIVFIGARPDRDPRNLNWLELPPQLRWNLRISFYKSENAELWLAAQNLLDSMDQSSYGYPLAGRELWLGLKLSH